MIWHCIFLIPLLTVWEKLQIRSLCFRKEGQADPKSCSVEKKILYMWAVSGKVQKWVGTLHCLLTFEAFTIKHCEKIEITLETHSICWWEVLIRLVDLWDNCTQQLPLRSIRRQEKNTLGSVQLLVKTGHEQHTASGSPALINNNSTAFVWL